MADPINVADIISRADEASKQNAVLMGQLRSDTADLRTVGTERATNAKADIEDQVIVALTKENALLQAQNQSNKAATSAGVNMSTANEVVSGILDKVSKAQVKRVQIAEEIAASEEKPLLPWMFDKMFVIPFKEDQLAAQGQVVNTGTDGLRKINETVQAQNITNAAIAEIRTDASVEANARIVARAAIDKYETVRLEGIRNNIAGVQGVLNATTSQLDQYFNTARLQLSAASLANEQERTDMARKKFKVEMDELLSKQESEQQVYETISTGMSAMGYTIPDKGRIRSGLAVGGDVKKLYEEAYMIGAGIKATGKTVINASPSQAISTVVKHQAPLTSEMQPVKNWLLEIAPKAHAKIAPKITDPKDIASVSAAMDKVIREEAGYQQSSIKPGDTTNIYAATSLAVVMQEKGIQEMLKEPANSFVKKVLEPLATTQAGPLNPQVFLAQVASAVNTGLTSPNQAALGVAHVFRVLAALNNETRRYEAFGLPKQVEYNVPFTHPTSVLGIAAVRKYNLMDPAQVSTLLSIELAAKVKNPTYPYTGINLNGPPKSIEKQ